MRCLIALLSLDVALPANASAGTAALASADPTSGEPDLLYAAAAGERNRVTVRFDGFQ